MSSYAKLLHDYNQDKTRLKNLDSFQQSTKTKVENLLSYIQLAQGTIDRMSTDYFGIETNEYCQKKNRLAIAEIQQRIAGHYLEIEELLHTQIAA